MALCTKTSSGVLLSLSKQEAEVFRAILQHVAGTGDIRRCADGIERTLAKVGVPVRNGYVDQRKNAFYSGVFLSSVSPKDG